MSLISKFAAVAMLLASLCRTSPLLAEGGVQITQLPKLEAPVTSFGAAVAGGHLYVFGGHLGTPHKYSAELQANQLLQLDLAQPEKWEVAAEGPRRTGLAMVAHNGQLYRVGG